MPTNEIRDKFAGKALEGLIAAHPELTARHQNADELSKAAQTLAVAAYRLADAMMSERAARYGIGGEQTGFGDLPIVS